MTLRYILFALAATAPATAWSGNLDMPPVDPPVAVRAQPAASPDLIFTLGAGLATTPEYFGSDEYTVGPDFSFRLNYLRLPGGRAFGNDDLSDPQYGVGLRGSLRYISKRDADDNAELAGLDDVDTSVELGLGIGYSSYVFDAFADLRYGVVGHDAFVGEVGADVKLHASDRLTLAMGPRLLLGTDDYATSYFGVSDAEAARSQFDAYDADGGLLSAGLEIGAHYEINQNWGIEGAVSWDRFTGDAQDSPIVETGDRDQYGLRIGVTRLITLDF